MGSRIVEIGWTKPSSPEQVERDRENFYQFYGCHPAYGKGKDALLYICGGREEEWSGEAVKERAPCYFKPEQITVLVGKILSNEGNVPLEMIEKILIFLHSPAWNAREVEDIYVPCSAVSYCKSVVINNTGRLGSLSETVRGEDCFV